MRGLIVKRRRSHVVRQRSAEPMNAGDRAQVASILPHRGEFFRVLQQTSRTQSAVMTVAPGVDAGPAEEHGGDQIVYVIEGEAIVRIGGREHRAGAGTLVTIRAGANHHVRNPGSTPLFFLTVYAPPEY
jgi:mannose-6-phosphate isomerase-like protein (cupin superfamily)